MNAVDEVTIRSRARSRVYSFLAVAFSDPRNGQAALLKQEHGFLARSLEVLGDQPSLEAIGPLRPSIASLSDAALERAYVRCFGHAISKDCPPYEAEYGQAHIFQKTQTLADIAGFYRAFGLEIAADSHERVDHISVELEFMHFLCLKKAYALAKNHTREQLALCREAQDRFLQDHVCRWAFGFARRVRAKAGHAFYRELGQLLACFLAAELHALGLKPTEVAGPDMIEEGAQALPEKGAGQPPTCEACHSLGGIR